MTGAEYRTDREGREKVVKIALGWVFALLILGALAGIALFQGAFAERDAGGDSEQIGSGAQREDARAADVGAADVGAADAQGASSTQLVVDYAGRSVNVPSVPQSIAALDSFAGELLVMAGVGSRICGVPGGVVSDSILRDIYPGLATEPVQMSGNAVNIETLMARECDVALIRETLSAAERDKLDRAQIPYVVVGYTTIEEQIAAIRLVGTVCGDTAAEKAEELARFYEETLATVEQRASQIPEEKRLKVYHAINDILLTDSQGSLGADWIGRVGCMDVAATSSATSGTDYQTTLEQVYVYNPDVIICNVAATAEAVKGDGKWAGLEAVANGLVYTIPTGATRWGQRGDVETYLAMLWLGCTVYPEYFGDIDLRQSVVAYYRDYLGVTVDDGLYEQMLSGEGLRSSGTGDGSGTGQGQGR